MGTDVHKMVGTLRGLSSFLSTHENEITQEQRREIRAAFLATIEKMYAALTEEDHQESTCS